jgi:hypothetical protein
MGEVYARQDAGKASPSGPASSPTRPIGSNARCIAALVFAVPAASVGAKANEEKRQEAIGTPVTIETLNETLNKGLERAHPVLAALLDGRKVSCHVATSAT